MERSFITRFFGGPPVWVLARLVFMSFVVGIILSALGISPHEILDSFVRLIRRIYEMGFDAIDWAIRYFIIGAFVVFPVWFIMRVLKFGKRGMRQLPPPEQ
ncbi:MAG: integrase [Hyphomicrobiales bacterium]|nr:integrase [Hyphomicrobiales bacterium]